MRRGNGASGSRAARSSSDRFSMWPGGAGVGACLELDKESFEQEQCVLVVLMVLEFVDITARIDEDLLHLDGGEDAFLHQHVQQGRENAGAGDSQTGR